MHFSLPTTPRPRHRSVPGLAAVALLCGAIALPHAPAAAQGKATQALCGQVVPDTEKAIVRILKIPKARLQPQLRLVEDLGATEYRLADLTMHLEDEFLVELPDELSDVGGTTMQAYTDALDKALGCPARR